jgi:hypothetical protein
MTDKPKAERPAAQPGTPQLAREIVNAYEDKHVHLRGYYSRTDLLAIVKSAVAEREAQAPQACATCLENEKAGLRCAECNRPFRAAEAPAQTAAHECKQLFLRIKEHDYPWLSWFIDDLQIAVIVDAMEAWAATRLALSSAASSPEPAAPITDDPCTAQLKRETAIRNEGMMRGYVEGLEAAAKHLTSEAQRYRAQATKESSMTHLWLLGKAELLDKLLDKEAAAIRAKASAGKEQK